MNSNDLLPRLKEEVVRALSELMPVGEYDVWGDFTYTCLIGNREYHALMNAHHQIRYRNVLEQTNPLKWGPVEFVRTPDQESRFDLFVRYARPRPFNLAFDPNTTILDPRALADPTW